MALEDSNLEFLLKKANEHERKYEWLQATKFYKKASELATKNKDFWKIGELNEKLGFCFFRAASQSKTRKDLIIKMKWASEAYQKAINYFQKTDENKKEIRIKHNTALIAYVGLWLDTEQSKRDMLFHQYWSLENEVLRMHEEARDNLAVGTLCNEMIKACHDQYLFYVTDGFEFKKLSMECFALGEKAIEVLSKIDADYELAFAYSWSSWLLGFVVLVGGYQNMKKEYPQKSVEYVRKALTLSKKSWR